MDIIRLLGLALLFGWIDSVFLTQAIDSPRLTDLSKLKQSYVVWPANTPLSLKCKADGAEPLKISWYKDGKLVKPSENILQDQKWNLKFRKPQRSDDGIYTCIISNEYGEAKHSYSLRILQRRIQSAPELVPGYPKPVTARVGDNVELECLEQPNGQVSDYRWLKTDSLVKNNPVGAYDEGNVDMISPKKYKSFAFDDDEETKFHGVKLELKHVTEEDEGNYTCFLSNNNGFTHGTTYLNVTPILRTDPPEFLVPKHKRRHFIVSVEDEDVQLSCSVRGGAPLKYEWFYNEKPLSSDEKHKISESELTVRHVQQADNGVYTCKIRNDYGHVKHNFRLKVIAKEPMFPRYPVLLAGYPKDKTAMIGGSASLYCADTTEALVDYRWLKWDSSVKSFTKADLLNATMFTILHPKHYKQSDLNKNGVYLILKNLTMADQGLYTCLVSSYMGYSYKSAYLTLQHPLKKDPETPTDLLNAQKTSPEITNVNISTNEVIPTSPITKRRCYNYEAAKNEEAKDEEIEDEEVEDSDYKTKCETVNACATVLDENSRQMFCDELDLCKKYNVSSGKCFEVTPESVLCCCTGELCNQHEKKLFQKTPKKTKSSSTRPQVMPVIFFSVLVLTISLMLALLGYRIRQRKAALKESIVHETRSSSRKITKLKVMETRWLKEDV